MLKIKEYVKAESLEQAYELNQKKTNCVIGGMLWLKMVTRNVQKAIDLSGLGLDQIEEDDDDKIHHSIDIGYSKSLINYKISLSINRLFNIHTAVLGNSGSGKSNTIARILQEVFRKENNHAYGSKVILRIER